MSDQAPENTTPATVSDTSAAATPLAADVASSAPAFPPLAAPSSTAPEEADVTTEAPESLRAVGSTVEFQTFDPITGQHLRGFGIVRGHQDDVDGGVVTLVTPLAQGVLLITDDEILPGG